MKTQQFIDLCNSAIDKLEAQGRPSKLPTGLCRYLSPEGDCCIVGHMMPSDIIRRRADEHPNPDICHLKKDKFNWLKQFTLDQIMVLADLQLKHDHIKVNNGYGCLSFEEAIDSMRRIVGRIS